MFKQLRIALAGASFVVLGLSTPGQSQLIPPLSAPDNNQVFSLWVTGTASKQDEKASLSNYTDDLSKGLLFGFHLDKTQIYVQLAGGGVEVNETTERSDALHSLLFPTQSEVAGLVYVDRKFGKSSGRGEGLGIYAEFSMFEHSFTEGDSDHSLGMSRFASGVKYVYAHNADDGKGNHLRFTAAVGWLLVYNRSNETNYKNYFRGYDMPTSFNGLSVKLAFQANNFTVFEFALIKPTSRNFSSMGFDSEYLMISSSAAGRLLGL